MSETRPPDPPSPFVARWVERLLDRPASAVAGRRRALDLAMGRGRHAAVLAKAGWDVFGVDRNFDAVHDAVERVLAVGCPLKAWCADLTSFPLPRGRFELIVVARYLQRDLFPALKDALTPGGLIVYETFTRAQLEHGRGPTSSDHLLAHGELLEQFGDFEQLFYEEVSEPDAYARLCARKPGSR
jgi:SAM-dependent methyltransferase